ncbi:MAG: type II secretion system GspH family protein [Chromatiales bacterium]|nr:type II secretion system GspH family protein [Chromatiales bacterium]
MSRQHGFTLIELVMTLVLIGILVATVAPRFNASVFDLEVARSDLITAIRFAQQHSMSNTGADPDADGSPDYYTVTLTSGGFSVTLTDANSSNTVVNPATGSAPFTSNWESNITLSPAATIRFNGRGEPLCIPACSSANLPISLSDGTQTLAVTLERITGYLR